jgi:hypothetical protein
MAMHAHARPQVIESSWGWGLLLLLAVLAAISTAMLFRPLHPSTFTEHGAFGAGYGSQSLMFGASPRAGAPRLN